MLVRVSTTGIKEGAGETWKATIAADPHARAVSKGVVNRIVNITISCVVPTIAIITFNSLLVRLDKLSAHSTWMLYTTARIGRNISTQ